jgi:hypothetical protein
LDDTISDGAMPAPTCLHNWRKGLSVTPAMGARNRLFFNVYGPICTSLLLSRTADGKGRIITKKGGGANDLFELIDSQSKILVEI